MGNIDGIQRSDWGDGDLRGGEPVGRQVATVESKPQSLAEVKPGEVVSGQELTRLAQQDGSLSHQDRHAAWRDGEGRFVSKALAGQWPALMRELHYGHESFAENFSTMRGHVDRWLGANTNDPGGFVEIFDELPASVQDRALQVFRHNPSMSFQLLARKVVAKLTLQERHDAEQWWRKFR